MNFQHCQQKMFATILSTKQKQTNPIRAERHATKIQLCSLGAAFFWWSPGQAIRPASQQQWSLYPFNKVYYYAWDYTLYISSGSLFFSHHLRRHHHHQPTDHRAAPRLMHLMKKTKIIKISIENEHLNRMIRSIDFCNLDRHNE